MGEISFDRSEERQEPQRTGTNAPLMIALACALLLVALFVAAMEAEAQGAAQGEVRFGSIHGRVIASEPQHSTGGIRILVRRIHAGAGDFYFERVTGADGSFQLRSLLPGTYTIQMDTGTLKTGGNHEGLLLVRVEADRTAKVELVTETLAEIHIRRKNE